MSIDMVAAAALVGSVLFMALAFAMLTYFPSRREFDMHTNQDDERFGTIRQTLERIENMVRGNVPVIVVALLLGALSQTAHAQFSGQVFNDGFASCAGSNMRAGQFNSGRATFTKLADPVAPQPVTVGPPGSASYTFYLVGHDVSAPCGSGNEGVSLPSPAGSISNAPNVLTLSNYVAVALPLTINTGYSFYDVLLNDTSHSLQTCVAAGTTLNYTGQSTSTYTAPADNTTGDVSAVGYVISKDSASTGSMPVGVCRFYTLTGTGANTCKVMTQCGGASPQVLLDNIPGC